ncbi:MAG: holo-ACP synthase [Sulfuricellaceae bacterium]|jgi:holo-[acyl-carrier protein] synthase
MIYGIGTDIVSVERMAASLARFGESFAHRLLAEDELADFHAATKRERFLAKRFAAKEALSKAAGMGLRHPVTLKNISVTHDGLGKPGFRFSADLAGWMAEQGVRACHLSISDEQHTACAFVVLER